MTTWLKHTLILFLAFFVFGLAACQSDVPDTPNVLPPTIMIDGVIYRSYGKELDAVPDKSAYSGQITSVVKESTLPTKNGEANVRCLDSPYVILDEGIGVLVNERWLLFERAEE